MKAVIRRSGQQIWSMRTPSPSPTAMAEGKRRGSCNRVEEDRPGQAGEGRGTGSAVSHVDPDSLRCRRRPRGRVAEGDMSLMFPSVNVFLKDNCHALHSSVKSFLNYPL